MTKPPVPPQPAAGPEPTSLLGRLDAWMAANPWHPRATPFFVYMLGILFGQLVYTGAFGLPELPALRPVVYTVQVGIVVFLLVRYRKLLPELNIKFHWLAVPTGIGLLFAWVHLGYATNWVSHQLQDFPAIAGIADYLVPTSATDPYNVQPTSSFTEGRDAIGDAWYWSSLSLRLLGMSLVVPLFEELWSRSAVLRGTFSVSKTKTAIIQLAGDLPLIGEAVSQSKAGQRAAEQPPMFTRQLESTPVGRVSLFAVAVSTFIFMLAHQQRDYLGCVACGVVWCWLVWYTNKPKPSESWDDQPAGGRYGLGPIVWSHGITNAGLWAWTLIVGDWQFL